jgi:hypothetical protein
MPTPSDKSEIDEKNKAFKSAVVSATPSLVTLKEKRAIQRIPDEVFGTIFRTVFNRDLKLARHILNNQFDKIELESAEAEAQVDAISTIKPASDVVADAIEKGHPILMIGDADPDGCFAQSIAMEFGRITGGSLDDDGMTVGTRDYNSTRHGFGTEQVDNWLYNNSINASADFVVFVADLGTNQREEQALFLSKYPKANLIIADHHRPDADSVVFAELDVKKVPLDESGQPDTLYLEKAKNLERSFFVSPYIKNSAALGLKSGGGVSGGYLTYAILKQSLLTLFEKGIVDIPHSVLVDHMKTLKDMGEAANLLDGVGDILIKPLHEGDITKALGLAKITQNGRSVGKWLAAEQVASVRALSDHIGVQGVDDFISIRARLIKQNHIASALFELVPNIISKKVDVAIDVSKSVALKISGSTAEETIGTNYVEKMRPYLYSFMYENQLNAEVKKDWLQLAEGTLNRVGKLEKEIVDKIRDHQLVNEISDDFISLTQSISPSVNKAFTTKQITKAYHGLTKPVTLTVSKMIPGQVVMSYRSSVSMSEALRNTSEKLLGIKTSMRGHDGVGGLILNVPSNMSPQDALSMFIKQMNVEIKSIKDNQHVPESFEVMPIHLSLLKEMLQKMRVHLVPNAAPMMIMKISANTTFEDRYSLEKKSVSKIIEGREWETTVESLNFASTSSLLLPNQALKAVANDGFKGGLGITLMPNGSYIASEFFTGAQLSLLDIPKLKTPSQDEQASLSTFYKKHFISKDVPRVRVPRKEAVKALKFTRNSEQAFNQTEAIILGTLRATGADSYAVIDVEADGAGNAKCFNVGLTIYTKKPNSGELVSELDFTKKMQEEPEGIKNFQSSPDGLRINEQVDIALVSLVIGRDGESSQHISMKAQNLTNIDQAMIDDLGMSSKEAQEKLHKVLDGIGNFIIQAHNLPYDNNIMRVNFPEIFERMRTAIHLDSAVLSRMHQIVYLNMQVTELGGKDFFVGNHDGYNLNTLMASDEDFEFPSVKGDALLIGRGDTLRILDVKTRIVTQLNSSRQSVLNYIPAKTRAIRNPEFGIQKMMSQATIHDIIISESAGPTNSVNFDGRGSDIDMPDELWELFQKNYSYDDSPLQNLAKLNMIPGTSEDVPNADGQGQEPKGGQLSALGEVVDKVSAMTFKEDEFIPGFLSNVKPIRRSKQKVVTFMYPGVDIANEVLKQNAEKFVEANPANAERFALAWAYDLVLNHYEPTVKTLSAGFIAGVSASTGIIPSVINKIYSDLYEYKSKRSIESFHVAETHNNFDLEGDAYQEMNVFMHMLYRKLKNPFLTGASGLTSKVNPYDVVVDELRKQAAESTMRQIIRDTLGVVISSDDVNSYSAKQLDNFDSGGVSIALEREGVTKMKCKTLWGGDSVSVELPNFKAERFRAMSEESRKEIESNLQLAVSTLYLANSRFEPKIKDDPDAVAMIEKVVLSQDLLDNLKYIDNFLGGVNVSARDDTIKKIMTSAVKAIARGVEFKVPTNADLNHKEVDIVHDAIKGMIARLKKQQNFISELTPEILAESMEMAKLEFDVMSSIGPNQYADGNAKNVPGYERVISGHKKSVGARIKAMNRIMPAHLKLAPDFSQTLLSKKLDPILCLVNSDMSGFMIKSKLGNTVTGLEIDALELDDIENKNEVRIGRP